MRVPIGAAALALGVLLTSAPAAPPPDDPFAAGAVWEGDRFRGKKRLPEWELKVIKRTEDKFEGEITIIRGRKESDTYKVSGKATWRKEGEITFKSEKSGYFEQAFQGRLKNGEILLNYTGVDESGNNTAGTATLKPKAASKN